MDLFGLVPKRDVGVGKLPVVPINESAMSTLDVPTRTGQRSPHEEIAALSGNDCSHTGLYPLLRQAGSNQRKLR